MLMCMININIVWIKQYADVTDDEENIFLPELQPWLNVEWNNVGVFFRDIVYCNHVHD